MQKINLKNNNNSLAFTTVALFIGLMSIMSILEASHLISSSSDILTIVLSYSLMACVPCLVILTTEQFAISSFSAVLLSVIAAKPTLEQYFDTQCLSIFPIFVDGATFWLMWLVTLVGYVVFFGFSDRGRFKQSQYTKTIRTFSNVPMFAILASVVICFSTKNILIFFVFFELILLPLILIISAQGSRGNRLVAVKYLACYTLVGSIFLWVPVIYLVELLGSADFDTIQYLLGNFTTSGLRKILFASMLVGFFFKVPVVPMHQWLIIAHVEAPTSGSIVLAALLLKIGGYGIYRFCFTLFPIESFIYSNYILGIALFGYTVATLLAIRQVDVKRFIAYTSISHMNYSLMGLFSGSEIGVLGFFHTMISHGIIATAMFYLVGHLYSILGYRDSVRISGLAEILPTFSFFWFFFTVANMGLPLFSAFPGELFILIALTEKCVILPIFVFVGFFFTGVYSFMQINKMLFSSYRGSHLTLIANGVTDLSSRSISILITLSTSTVTLGLCPDIISCSLNY